MPMFDGTRLRDLMSQRDISQSKLARKVGVSQTTIAKLVLSKGYGSKHLHRIARELGTTPAYLEGETDDPSWDAAPPQEPIAQPVMMPVLLPTERALKVMFKALLSGIDRGLDEDEQALLLAQRLPIGLAQLQYARFDLPKPAAETADEDLAKSDREPVR